MATNLRYEASSPDGSQFLAGLSNGHRGVPTASMDRSGSFRDNHDGRCAASPPACDPTPLSQLLSLETIPPLGEYRYVRQLELRRTPTGATGDDPGLGQIQMKPLDTLAAEDLKRVKANISDISNRARDRSRHLCEAIQKLDRYIKKRSRPELSNERPIERPNGAAPSVQAKVPASADAGKNRLKRLRTSITADVRDGGRQANATMKKATDRESPRSSTVLPSPTAPTEEKARAPAETWDRAKLKGKRSAVKSDAAISAVVNGALDQERDHKWSGQHRLSQESRPRPSDAHGLRSGPVHGITSIHKGEATLQMNGSASRGITKGDCEGPAAEKIDRLLGTEKERVPKNGLKPSLQDETQPGIPIMQVTKGKAARPSRSSSMASANPSHPSRAPAFTDREKPQGAKLQPSSSQGNRKRPAPSRSSSPVAQWVGQRPQKMARVARRVNLPPGGALPTSDVSNITPTDSLPERDSTALASGPRSAIPNNGASGVSRRVSAHSPGQGKPRSERPVLVSESEESEEVGDSKLKDKGKRQAEWDSRTSGQGQKASSLVVPPKITPPLVKEEVGDGIRRQGRSGRNSAAVKPTATSIEKAEICTSTAKQLRSARIEKPERPGRTPTKKATADRKAITRIRRPSGGSVAIDAGLPLVSPGDSDDDHEELANAVRAAVDASAAACKNDFWKEMEPYFAYITPDDLSYLRQLADSKWCSDNVSSTPSTDGTPHFPNGGLEFEMSPERLEVRSGGRIGGGGGWFDRIYPLSQRLLAALINEAEDDSPSRERYPSMTSDGKYRDPDGSQKPAEASLYSNGHHQNMFAWEDAEVTDIVADDRPGIGDGNHLAGTNRATTAWENQYEHMSLDDRILLELQSIGLAVEQVPDLSQRDEDEICLEICKLQDELKDQTCINKERVETLEKAVLSRREPEARDRERLAISKLVESAYMKRKGCRGSSASGTKGSGTKAARTAALAFSKRALARLQQFESGHSCFDSTLRDILLCAATTQNEATEAAPDAEAFATPTGTESLPRHAGKAATRRAEKPEVLVTDHPRGSSWVPQNEEHGPRTVGFGGAKGKRSERDAKGHGKESQRKQENDRVSRQGVVKGERKIKTKPRQKAAPVFKDVNGLLGKPASDVVTKQKPLAALPAPVQVPLPPATAETMDLALAIPEVLGDHDEAQDIGAWLDLADTTLDAQDDLIGLDVPMDDLADLGMMM